MDLKYDVVVIGGGPIGGYLSRRFNEFGHSVLIIEEHDEIGRPFQCAGLVNPESMKKVNLHNSILKEIWGARIHSPSGIPVVIGNNSRIRTMSVCRKIFDEGVVLQAIKSGTEILLSSKPNFVNIETDRVKLEIKTPEGIKNIESKLLCGADGAHSWVRRFFKMGRPKEMMIGFQIEVTGYEGDEGRLDMYTGRDIAPGYFAWAIPSGDSTRIGTWSRADLLNGFSCEDLIDRLKSKKLWNHRFENITEIGRFVGPVPSGFVKKPMIERVALFGDAAGVCKPTTGGGIGPGFNQVDLLVPILSKSIINNDLSDIKMKKHSKLLKSMISDQKRKKGLRDAFLSESNDDELNEIFSVWSRPEVIELINEVGEIENPIPLGIRMLKEIPEFRKLAGKAAKALIWG